METQYERQIFHILVFFYCTALNKIQVFRSIYAICSYSLLQSLVIRCILSKSRSNCPEVPYKKGAHKKFTKFKRKHLCQGLLVNKVADLRRATLLKKRLWHWCFPVSFRNFYEDLFYTTLPVFQYLVFR